MLLLHPFHKFRPLLPQCDPYPEPGYHLDEHEREEDSVLQAIATPARDVVR